MSAVLQTTQGGDRFERMHESDLDAVMEIEQRIYAFPWTKGNFRDSIRADYGCWVFRSGASMLGYAVLLVAAGESHLLNLSIDAPYQRQGHGRRLLQHMIVAARESGATILFLEVRPSNAAGLELYARSGFKQVGLRRDYYPANSGREDALVLALEL